MSNFITKGGQITTRKTKRGIEFHAFNFQRGGMVFIGTKKGAVYEKVAAIFRMKQTFNLTQIEFGKVQELDTGFIRIIPPDKSGTYAISVQDFDRYKEPHYDPSYGPQWCCALVHFSRSGAVTPRNAHRDNPVLEVARPIVREKQMTLFQ